MRVHVTVVSGAVLISRPHLSRSSPHVQPIGTSQLDVSAQVTQEAGKREIAPPKVDGINLQRKEDGSAAVYPLLSGVFVGLVSLDDCWRRR